MPFGLRATLHGHTELRLQQITGGGRVQVSAHQGTVKWWRDPKGLVWEVVPDVEEGRTYDTRELAERVARNLSGRN